MGKAKPVTLGHLTFAKQGDALDYFKAILNRHPIGTTLSSNDFRDVEALLSGHPRAQQKIGVGIKSLKIDTTDTDERCFHVIRTDGSKDNFSYKKCIAGDPAPFTEFSAACRRVVDADLLAFKTDYFAKKQNDLLKVKCPETGQWLSWDEAQVDHRSPHSFSVIVSFFVNAKKIDFNAVQYDRAGLYGRELTDRTLGDSFREWHKENAILRVIEARRNLAKAPLARIKLTKHDQKLAP